MGEKETMTIADEAARSGTLNGRPAPVEARASYRRRLHLGLGLGIAALEQLRR